MTKKKRHVRLWQGWASHHDLFGRLLQSPRRVSEAPRSPGAHSARFGNLVLPLVIAPRMAASCRSALVPIIPTCCTPPSPSPVDSSRDLHVILCAGTEAGLGLEAGCHLAPPGVPQERRDPASRARRPRMALHLAALRSSLQIIPFHKSFLAA